MNNLTNYTYTYVETKTPEDIYSNQYLMAGIPRGYSIEDFRPPNCGELFLSDIGTVMQRRDCTPYTNDPRFILKKLPEIIQGCEETCISVNEVYGRDVAIPEGWKFVSFGIPRHGDHVMRLAGNSVSEVGWNNPDNSIRDYLPRIIVKKV